jgi:hypothetical protein
MLDRRRTLLVAGFMAAALPLLDCAKGRDGAARRRAPHRVFVMGFDGMDPALSRRMMAEGKLPNFRRLADSGSFAPLGTTQPSESPVAWASSATGVNPGKHNIYDFLVRDTRTYLPEIGMVRGEPPRFLWGFLPVKPPKVESIRDGTSFWVHAGRDGIRTKVITAPLTFPPERVAHGELLSGLGVPDIRGTWGTFYYWASDLPSFEEGNTELGGYLKRLLFEGGVSKTLHRGPDSPVLRQEEAGLREKQKTGALSEEQKARLERLATANDISLPMAVRWSEGSGRVEIEIKGHTLRLQEGEWSPRLPLRFRVNLLVSLRGIAQFHLVKATDELQL